MNRTVDLTAPPAADTVAGLLQAARVVDDALLLKVLQVALDERRRDVVWLALALLHPELPVMIEVERVLRRLRLDGPAVVLAEQHTLVTPTARPLPALHDRLVLGGTLVDVHGMLDTTSSGGHHRVVGESLRRWAATQDCRVVGWTGQLDGLRDLDGAEHQHLTGMPARSAPSLSLIPWHCTYVLPEVALTADRQQRLSAMAEAGVIRLGAVVYDLVPITAGETAGPTLPGTFATYLGLLRYATTLAAISTSSATEYHGWCAMLAGQGLTGPQVVQVPLPAEPVDVGAEDMLAARAQLRIGELPMVLAVGTHGPRKNLLALLHAAELLWRDGLEFCLVLVGHSGEAAQEFLDRVAVLTATGRALVLVDDASEALLWASYHTARVVAFPSLHEGFALPVAEALACGTPVVTSNVGSMLQLALEGGALAVDPFDDHALTEALRTVLTDDAVHAELSAAARARTVRTWDVYAAEAWRALVGPDRP